MSIVRVEEARAIVRLAALGRGGIVSDLLTTAEAAARLGRSRAFVLALVADGLVVGHKRGGRWYVSRRSLDAWIAGGETTPAPGRLVVIPRKWNRDAA